MGIFLKVLFHQKKRQQKPAVWFQELVCTDNKRQKMPNLSTCLHCKIYTCFHDKQSSPFKLLWYPFNWNIVDTKWDAFRLIRSFTYSVFNTTSWSLTMPCRFKQL